MLIFARVYCAVFGFFFFRAYRQTLFFLSFSFSICFSAFSLSVFRSELFSFLPETSYLLLLRIAYVRSITAPAMIIIPPIVKTAVPMPPVIGRLKLLLPFVRTKFNCHVFCVSTDAEFAFTFVPSAFDSSSVPFTASFSDSVIVVSRISRQSIT